MRRSATASNPRASAASCHLPRSASEWLRTNLPLVAKYPWCSYVEYDRYGERLLIESTGPAALSGILDRFDTLQIAIGDRPKFGISPFVPNHIVYEKILDLLAAHGGELDKGVPVKLWPVASG